MANNNRPLARATLFNVLHGEQWDCANCAESHQYDAGSLDSTPFSIEGYNYCIEEIQRQFQLALDYEGSWPLGIGNHTIRIDDFAGYIDPDFIARYRAQEQVYNAGALLMRIHCPYDLPESDPAARCNRFIGRRVNAGADNTWQACPQCEGNVCMICGGREDNIPAAMSSGHRCEPSPELEAHEAMKTGQDRGYIYQLCPRCDRVISLDGGCNHIRCCCGTPYCLVCGKEHEDIEGDVNGHWRQRPSCPRNNRPNPRRGHAHPFWGQHEYELQDVARTLFEPREIELADVDMLYPSDIATVYPRDRDVVTFDRDDLAFEPLLTEASNGRGLARRVTAIHDRLLRGDFKQFWVTARRGSHAEGEALVKLLGTISHVVTYMYNRRNEDDQGMLLRFASDLPENLRPIANGWQVLLDKVRPVQFSREEDPVSQRQVLIEVTSLAEKLATEWNDANYRARMDALSPEQQQTDLDIEIRRSLTLLVDVLNETIPHLRSIMDTRPGRLSAIESEDWRHTTKFLRGWIRIIQGLSTPEQFRDRSEDHEMSYDLAAALPDMLVEAADGNEQGDEAGYWSMQYEWLQDLLLGIAEVRLQLAREGQVEPPRLDELYYILREMEPAFAHMATAPTRYMAMPREAWKALIRLRDLSDYEPGEGPLSPVFMWAYSYLQNLLDLYGSEQSGEPDPVLARQPSLEDIQQCSQHLDQVSDLLIRNNETAIRVLEAGNQVPGRVRTMIDLLSAMRYLLRRLTEPNIHPREQNREMYERVREAYIRVTLNVGDFQGFAHEWDESHPNLYRTVGDLVHEVEANQEINPEAQPVRELLATRLRSAHDALLGSTARQYVDGIYHVFERERHVWSRPNCVAQQDASTFLRVLENLREVLAIEDLPQELASGYSREQHTDHLWRAERRWHFLLAQGVEAGELLEWVPRVATIRLQLIERDMGQERDNSVEEWQQRMEEETGLRL